MPLQRLIKALAYRANGLNHLGVKEFELALAEPEGVGGGETSLPWSRAQIHLLSAILFTYQGELSEADKEIMEAIKVDPGGPIAAFVTGERLTADGEYEKAAESLETYLARAGDADSWLAKRLTERAREIRDKRGDAEPLCHDIGFACEVGLHYMGQDLAKSPAGQKLNQWAESARRFGAQLTTQLAGGPAVSEGTAR